MINWLMMLIGFYIVFNSEKHIQHQQNHVDSSMEKISLN